MNEFLWYVALAAIVWCGALSLALIAIWSRTRSRGLESPISQLQVELHKLSSSVARLRDEFESLRPPQVGPAASLKVTGPPIPDAAPIPPRAPEQSPVPEQKPPPPRISAAASPPPRAYSSAGIPRPPVRSSRELEALIGGNWLLKIGILAIVLGAVYFLKYAFDNQWIGDWGRVGIGAIAGLGMLGAGEIFQRKNYPLYGQAVVAGGISILYLSIYAAYNFYDLMAVIPAFLCMALVSASGSVLSQRHQSKTLAVMSLLGGLLTPVWLSTGRNNEAGLLGYLFILSMGTGLLARHQRWLFLNAISLGGTVILFYLWAVRYYGPYALWTTETFLVLFAGLYLFLSWNSAREQQRADADSLFGEPMMAAVAVLFFVSSSAVLGPQPLYYWCFLLLFDALVLWASWMLPAKMLAPPTFLLNVLGITAWLSDHYHPSSRWLVFSFLSAIFVLFLAQQILRRARLTIAADLREVLACIGTGIGYFGASYYLMWQPHRRWMGVFAMVLSGAYLATARFLFRARETARPVAQAFLGIAATLLVLAVPIELETHWITIGWAAEAAILTWIGLASGGPRFRQGGLVILGFSLIRLIALDAAEHVLHYTPILNARVFTFLGIIASVYVMTYLYRRYSFALDASESYVRTWLMILASALSVILISNECWAYYADMRRQLMLSHASRLLARTDYMVEMGRVDGLRQVALSVLWSGYSIAVVVAGIRFRFRPIRVFGIALFFLTIFKVFAVDIWSLERLYRIISTITVGLILLGVAFLYHRFRKLVIEA